MSTVVERTNDPEWRAAYAALGKVLDSLEPLSQAERARVLLHMILRFTPHAFTDAELMALVRKGREPPP